MAECRILLLAKDRRTRVLVRAQLIEEGIDVTALEDPGEGRARVLAGEAMDLVIVDEADWQEGAAAADWIHRLRPGLPMLLLEHAWEPSAPPEVEPPAGSALTRKAPYRLARPFSVDDLVEIVKRLIQP